jgi:hypothetical protein
VKPRGPALAERVVVFRPVPRDARPDIAHPPLRELELGFRSAHVRGQRRPFLAARSLRHRLLDLAARVPLPAQPAELRGGVT